MNNQAKIRKITGATSLLIILLSLMLLIGTNGAAFAMTVDSDVYSDLLQMTIDGKKFDVADYPANENGETRMLSFIEYGYSFDDAARDKFALFAYVYNPKRRCRDFRTKQDPTCQRVRQKRKRNRIHEISLATRVCQRGRTFPEIQNRRKRGNSQTPD